MWNRQCLHCEYISIWRRTGFNLSCNRDSTENMHVQIQIMLNAADWINDNIYWVTRTLYIK
jgi:hypothetical protein